MNIKYIIIGYSKVCFYFLLLLNLIVLLSMGFILGFDVYYTVFSYNTIKYAEYLLWFSSPILFWIAAYTTINLFRRTLYSIIATLLASIPLIVSNKLI